MTVEEQLTAWRSYLAGKRTVYIFRHGTCVLADDEPTAKAIMQSYDVPNAGEGSPLGDMNPLEMKDGNVIVFFPDATGRMPAARILGASELQAEPEVVETSKTEVFLTPMVSAGRRLLGHCLAARAARQRDARELEVVSSLVSDG